MRLAATLEFAGSVYALAEGVDPPRDGVSFRHDGEGPLTLYVNGMEVGELVTLPSVESEWVWTAGNSIPQDFIVTSSQLHCFLELPHVGDVP